jgi:hypothetical protein
MHLSSSSYGMHVSSSSPIWHPCILLLICRCAHRHLGL